MRRLWLALLLSAPVAAVPAQPTGEWRNPADSVHIAMRPCGNSLCGVVTWASARAQEDAAAGGTERLVGTQLFRGLVADGPGQWSGEVFVPDLGRSVAGTLAQVDAATLEVSGCVIPALVCQTQEWSRVPVRR